MIVTTNSRTSRQAATLKSLVDEPIATIAPEIYGHFTRRLGFVADAILGEGWSSSNRAGCARR